LVTGALALGFLPETIQAGSVTYAVSGNISGTGDYNADATFVTGMGTLTITLTNLQGNIEDVGQNLSALKFTLSNPSTLLNSTLGSGTGQEITIDSKTSNTLGSTVNAGWVYSSTGAVGLLDVLAGTGHAGPEHTIVGAPGAGGNYTNANGSLTGGSHNPFLYESATFVIDNSNITANTTVSSATFQFGTTDGSNQFTSSNPVVPEPSTLVLSTIGLGAVCVFGLYRSRRRPVVAMA
jgi:hypothetical protein